MGTPDSLSDGAQDKIDSLAKTKKASVNTYIEDETAYIEITGYIPVEVDELVAHHMFCISPWTGNNDGIKIFKSIEE